MKNEALILATQKKLKNSFWIWFVILVVLGVFSFFTSLPIPIQNSTLTINLQQMLILCLLGGIPGVLIWTKNKMKTLVGISDMKKRLQQYQKYARIRQFVFFILGFMVLSLHLFTGMNGALMLFLVLILLCMLITPSRNRMETEAQLAEPEPESESEPEA